MVDLKPDWLTRECHEAHISIMSTQLPNAIKHLCETQLPIPVNEAGELYEKLDARFKAWTGMSLAQWQGER